MARYLFGGTSADAVEAADGSRIPFAVGQIFDGPGETDAHLTDLLDLDGAPIISIQANAEGIIERFWGPDGTDILWADFGGASRASLLPNDTSARLTEHVTGEDPHGDRKFLTDKIGVPGGLATLDGRGQIPSTQLPNGLGGECYENFTLTADGPIPLTSAAAQEGRICRKFIRNNAATAVNATFDPAYRLSTAVTSAVMSIPAGQVLMVESLYSSLARAWVLIQRTTTSGVDGTTDPSEAPTGARPTVNAGTDAEISPLTTFGRTATESSNGSSILTRDWTIVSGPMGAGTSVGNAAALSWVPGSSPANTTDIRQPVIQEMCFQLTSTSENSTKDWTTAYAYIEDINDERGYTAGLVGFTSATGDMLSLIRDYSTAKPGNTLESYIPGLEACYTVGFGTGASAAAASNLGQPFIDAWKAAAANDPVFRRVQREFRKEHYWDDALAQALTDGLSPLGLALYYDVLVNHGVGSDPESFGGILAAARSSTPTPAKGGSEATYLLKVCDLRDDVLRGWNDYQVDGRSGIYRSLIQAGKFALSGDITWSVYGDSYTFNRPEPATDARIGTYTLRYSATNSVGTSTDDLVVEVAEPETEDPTWKLFSSLTDNFDDGTLSAALWPESYPDTGTGAPSEVGGRARIPVTTDYSAIVSASEYTLAGSHAFARVYAPAVNGATSSASLTMAISSAAAPEGTEIAIQVNSVTGNIRFSSNVDYWDTAAVSMAYSATTHAWIRVREAAGTLYWETSADGLTWTVRRQMATPTWVASAHDLSVEFMGHRDAGTVNYAEVDSFNVAP